MALIDRRPEEAAVVTPTEPAAEVMEPSTEAPTEPTAPPEPQWAINRTERTAQVRADFPSEFVLLLDAETGEMLVERNYTAAINPASMTKILTLLVAAEHVTPEAMEHGVFTMTRAVGDYCYINNCSVVGYEVDEVIPMLELFYGCILCSGADACLGLAQTIFGSHEAMVEAMNAKLEELGLSDTTHFVNCVGLYDKDHYSTVEDIAIILKAALENDFCRQVLETKVYNSVPTPQHPDGQVLSNLFSRRIQYQDTGSVEVFSAKTGYVEESGFCAASYGKTPDGRGYICVTGKSTGTNQSIKDHAELYRTYCPQFPDAT
jgi:D-alanyl-D-alanine carboxypeptidase (penicillin-binding protein 5/6)